MDRIARAAPTTTDSAVGLSTRTSVILTAESAPTTTTVAMVIVGDRAAAERTSGVARGGSGVVLCLTSGERRA
ncbi:MAG: hypothetical protein ABSH34_12355 [Verrucomicrobiota bacterium]|jgi:hypothetical protein